MLRLAHTCIVSLIDCNDCIQKDCSHSLNWNVLQDLLSIFWGLFIKSLLYTFMNWALVSVGSQPETEVI